MLLTFHAETSIKLPWTYFGQGLVFYPHTIIPVITVPLAARHTFTKICIFNWCLLKVFARQTAIRRPFGDGRHDRGHPWGVWGLPISQCLHSCSACARCNVTCKWNYKTATSGFGGWCPCPYKIISVALKLMKTVLYWLTLCYHGEYHKLLLVLWSRTQQARALKCHALSVTVTHFGL